MEKDRDLILLERGYWLALVFILAGCIVDTVARRTEVEAAKLDLQQFVQWFVTDSSHLMIAAVSFILAACMVASVMQHRQNPEERDSDENGD